MTTDLTVGKQIGPAAVGGGGEVERGEPVVAVEWVPAELRGGGPSSVEGGGRLIRSGAELSDKGIDHGIGVERVAANSQEGLLQDLGTPHLGQGNSLILQFPSCDSEKLVGAANSAADPGEELGWGLV